MFKLSVRLCLAMKHLSTKGSWAECSVIQECLVPSPGVCCPEFQHCVKEPSARVNADHPLTQSHQFQNISQNTELKQRMAWTREQHREEGEFRSSD
jgi:hypothetical protein